MTETALMPIAASAGDGVHHYKHGWIPLDGIALRTPKAPDAKPGRMDVYIDGQVGGSIEKSKSSGSHVTAPGSRISIGKVGSGKTEWIARPLNSSESTPRRFKSRKEATAWVAAEHKVSIGSSPMTPGSEPSPTYGKQVTGVRVDGKPITGISKGEDTQGRVHIQHDGLIEGVPVSQVQIAQPAAQTPALPEGHVPVSDLLPDDGSKPYGTPGARWRAPLPGPVTHVDGRTGQVVGAPNPMPGGGHSVPVKWDAATPSAPTAERTVGEQTPPLESSPTHRVVMGDKGVARLEPKSTSMMQREAMDPKSKYHVPQKPGESRPAYVQRVRNTVTRRQSGVPDNVTPASQTPRALPSETTPWSPRAEAPGGAPAPRAQTNQLHADIAATLGGAPKTKPGETLPEGHSFTPGSPHQVLHNDHGPHIVESNMRQAERVAGNRNQLLADTANHLDRMASKPGVDEQSASRLREHAATARQLAGVSAPDAGAGGLGAPSAPGEAEAHQPGDQVTLPSGKTGSVVNNVTQPDGSTWSLVRGEDGAHGLYPQGDLNRADAGATANVVPPDGAAKFAPQDATPQPGQYSISTKRTGAGPGQEGTPVHQAVQHVDAGNGDTVPQAVGPERPTQAQAIADAHAHAGGPGGGAPAAPASPEPTVPAQPESPAPGAGPAVQRPDRMQAMIDSAKVGRNPDQPTVHLQGIGKHPAKPVSEIKPGDKVVHNYGEANTVISNTDLGNGKHRIVLQGKDGKTEYTNTRNSGTLLGHRPGEAPAGPPATPGEGGAGQAPAAQEIPDAGGLDAYGLPKDQPNALGNPTLPADHAARADALRPMAQNGPDYNRAVADNLSTYRRLVQQPGREQEAAHWLRQAEISADRSGRPSTPEAPSAPSDPVVWDDLAKKPWSQIHNDFKSTDANGNRSVLGRTQNGATVSIPWRGPESRAADPNAPTTGAPSEADKLFSHGTGVSQPRELDGPRPHSGNTQQGQGVVFMGDDGHVQFGRVDSTTPHGAAITDTNGGTHQLPWDQFRRVQEEDYQTHAPGGNGTGAPTPTKGGLPTNDTSGLDRIRATSDSGLQRTIDEIKAERAQRDPADAIDSGHTHPTVPGGAGGTHRGGNARHRHEGGALAHEHPRQGYGMSKAAPSTDPTGGTSGAADDTASTERAALRDRVDAVRSPSGRSAKMQRAFQAAQDGDYGWLQSHGFDVQPGDKILASDQSNRIAIDRPGETHHLFHEVNGNGQGKKTSIRISKDLGPGEGGLPETFRVVHDPGTDGVPSDVGGQAEVQQLRDQVSKAATGRSAKQQRAFMAAEQGDHAWLAAHGFNAQPGDKIHVNDQSGQIALEKPDGSATVHKVNGNGMATTSGDLRPDNAQLAGRGFRQVGTAESNSPLASDRNATGRPASPPPYTDRPGVVPSPDQIRAGRERMAATRAARTSDAGTTGAEANRVGGETVPYDPTPPRSVNGQDLQAGDIFKMAKKRLLNSGESYTPKDAETAVYRAIDGGHMGNGGDPTYVRIDPATGEPIGRPVKMMGLYTTAQVIGKERGAGPKAPAPPRG